jgi:4-amino-4-deoxy-L-arabinose transferase-like glycosyltransferase
LAQEETRIERLAARNGGRIGLAALLAIVLLGLGLRMGEAWDGRPPVYDAVAYERIAANLERGDGFTLGAEATQPASNYSPGLPLLAGGLYELSGGANERLVRVVLALIGSLAVVFTYLIGRRLSGTAAGLTGAGAVAVYPALIEYQGMLMGEPLAATLLSAAVLAILWAGDRASRGRWLLAGGLLGALALVRPEYVGISLVLAVVVIAWGEGEWRSGMLDAAVLLAGVALLVSPWTLRNAIALDRLVPVSTGGGQVLFAGTYLPSGGDPERVGEEVLERHPRLTRRLSSPFYPDSATKRELTEEVLGRVRLEQILAALAALRHPGVETDEALGRMGRERLWEDLSQRPLDYAGFVAAKVWRAWSHGPRRVMEQPGWEIFHGVLICLGLLGFALLVRRRPREALLVGALLASVTAIAALLVASPRRVLVTVPVVATLAGVGLGWLTERPWKRHRDDRRGVSSPDYSL